MQELWSDPSHPYGAGMADDSPAKKKRRPRAELEELMLQGGVEVLQELGVETQLSSVSYAKVFEHLERTQGVRVTYGSVHERIWNSLQEYQLSVIERAGVWDQADDRSGDYSWADWLQTMVALSSGTDDTVAEAARSGARATYAARTAGVDGDDRLAALSTAVADGLRLRSFLTADDTGEAELRELAETILSDWFDSHAG